MGNFYTNLTVRTDDVAAVREALAGRQALLTPPINHQIVVYDAVCDRQDSAELERLAERLSAATGAPVLAALNHDDDILWLCLAEDGAVVDRYNSTPGYFENEDPRAPEGGDAARLVRAWDAGHPTMVEQILRAWTPFDDDDIDDLEQLDDGDGYVFEVERHAALAEVLRLPAASVGHGYRSAAAGTVPQLPGALLTPADR